MTWLRVHHHHHRHHHYHYLLHLWFSHISSQSSHWFRPSLSTLHCPHVLFTSQLVRGTSNTALSSLYSNRNSSSEIKLLDFICKASQIKKQRRNPFLSWLVTGLGWAWRGKYQFVVRMLLTQSVVRRIFQRYQLLPSRVRAANTF